MGPLPVAGKLAAFGVLFTGVLVLLGSGLGANDLVAGDEGYYGVMARNVLCDIHQLVNPSLRPLGPPGDKPFFYPLLLAAGMAAGGVDEVPLRLVNLVLAASVAIGLIGLGRSIGAPGAGWAAAVLYLCSPLLAYNGRSLRAETAVACFGTFGAWVILHAVALGHPSPGVARGVAHRAPQETSSGPSPAGARAGLAWTAAGLLAGALFGLGFLSKLWLAGIPACGALAAALAGKAPRRLLLASAIAFAAVGSIQLLLCAVTTPEHLRHWITVYFGFSLASRVSGEAFASYWLHPWSYYLLLVARSAALVLPLFALGLVVLLSRARRDRGARIAVALVIGWLLPLVPLSISRVKSGNYVFPLMPALLLTAGVGIDALRRALGGRERLPRQSLLAAAGASLALLLLGQLERGAAGLELFSPIPAVIQLAWVCGFMLLAFPPPDQRRSALPARLAVLGLLGLTLGAGLIRSAQIARAGDHKIGYEQLAVRLEPVLRDIDPRQPCFFAPEWPSLSFYTFRSGRYWESPYVPAAPDSVLAALHAEAPFFFVLDAGGGKLYGGPPDPTSRARIEAEGVALSWAPGSSHAGLTVFLNQTAGRLARSGSAD